jgi:hypothetical protein
MIVILHPDNGFSNATPLDGSRIRLTIFQVLKMGA